MRDRRNGFPAPSFSGEEQREFGTAALLVARSGQAGTRRLSDDILVDVANGTDETMGAGAGDASATVRSPMRIYCAENTTQRKQKHWRNFSYGEQNCERQVPANDSRAVGRRQRGVSARYARGRRNGWRRWQRTRHLCGSVSRSRGRPDVARHVWWSPRRTVANRRPRRRPKRGSERRSAT